MSGITLPRILVNQLLQQAQQSAEYEICGLISSKDGAPIHCYPAANVADNKQQRFELDPHGQISAMSTMREQGEQLFAIYHSHPTTSAEPSAIDLQHTEYADALRLIISLSTEGVLEMRAFKITDGGAEAVELSLEDV
jgi:proteasome lid subunit RPN8/RPN11